MTTALSRAITDPPEIEGIPDASSMAGLKRRTIGFVDVLAQSVGAVAPSAGASTVPALIAAQSGSAALISLVIAWLLALLVMNTINQFTRRMLAPGSLYTFVTKGFGPGAGFATAIAQCTGYGFIAMFGLVGAAFYAQTFLDEVLPGTLDPVGTVVVGLAVFGAVVYAVMRGGIRLSARVTLVIELASVIVIAALLVIVLVHISPDQLLAPFRGRMPGFGEIAAGTAVALTGFVGFESAAALGVEAAKPFAAIPRTMRWTVLSVGVLYLLSSYTQLSGFAGLGIPMSSDNSPVNVLAAGANVAWMGTVVDLGLTASFLACAIASLTALSRVLFSLGREGVLPRAFGTADAQRGTPHIALAAVVPVTVAVPIVFILSGLSLWTTLSSLLVVSAAGYLGSYVLVSAAAPAFLRRIGELTPWAAVRAYLAAAALAVVLVLYLAVSAEGQARVAVAIVAAVVVLGAAGYLVLRLARRRALARMGLFDQTTSADVLGARPGGGR